MLSIITPHYNAADKVQKLYECLANQTDVDFEWIIVDDCSNVEEYEKIMSIIDDGILNNVIVCRTLQNGGPGKARNMGLDIASGEYVTFIDADDLVVKEFVSTINESIVKGNPDILAFDYYRVTSEGKVRLRKVDYVNVGTLEMVDYITYSKNSVWGTAFKLNIIRKNNICFPDLYRFEDWVFNVKCAFSAHRIDYLSEPLYMYVEEKKSIVHSKKYKASEYAIKAFEMIEDILRKLPVDRFNYVFAREIIYVFALSNIDLDYREYKTLLKKIEMNNPNWTDECDMRKLPSHQRIILLFIKFRMYCVVYFGLKIITRG